MISFKGLFNCELRYTGVIKTEISQFPVGHFSHIKFAESIENHLMPSEAIDRSERPCKLLAIAWAARNRRYFVGTSTTTAKTEINSRVMRRKCDNIAMCVEIPVTRPSPVKQYFENSDTTDYDNCYWQDVLNLENKIEVLKWSFRVNSTLLRIIIEDAWLH